MHCTRTIILNPDWTKIEVEDPPLEGWTRFPANRISASLRQATTGDTVVVYRPPMADQRRRSGGIGFPEG